MVVARRGERSRKAVHGKEINMLYNITIAERNSYPRITLKNYDEQSMVALLAVLSEDDEIDITISPFHVPVEEEETEEELIEGVLYKNDEKVDPSELPDEDKEMLRKALTEFVEKMEKGE